MLLLLSVRVVCSVYVICGFGEVFNEGVELLPILWSERIVFMSLVGCVCAENPSGGPLVG